MWELWANRVGKMKPQGVMYWCPLLKKKRKETMVCGSQAITKPRLMQKNIWKRMQKKTTCKAHKEHKSVHIKHPEHTETIYKSW